MTKRVRLDANPSVQMLNDANSKALIGDATTINPAGGVMTLTPQGLLFSNTDIARYNIVKIPAEASNDIMSFCGEFYYDGSGTGDAFVTATARVGGMITATTGNYPVQFRVSIANVFAPQDSVGATITASGTITAMVPKTFYRVRTWYNRTAGSVTVELRSFDDVTVLGLWTKASGATLGDGPTTGVELGHSSNNQVGDIIWHKIEFNAGTAASIAAWVDPVVEPVGTVGATLDPASLSDGTPINSDSIGTIKGGFTTLQGTFSEFVERPAKSMGGARGMSWEAPTVTARGFWDFTNTNPIFAFRKYVSISDAPAVLTPTDRFFPSSAHATATCLNVSLGTDRKFVLTENAATVLTPTSGTNVAIPSLVTAGASPALAHLCILGLIYGATGDANAGKVLFRAYLRGSRVKLFDLVFQMVTPLTMSSWRMGIDAAGTGMTLTINDQTAWGFGGWLPRLDIPTMTLNPPPAANGAAVSAGTVVATIQSGETGTGKMYRWEKDGVSLGAPQSNPSLSITPPLSPKLKGYYIPAN